MDNGIENHAKNHPQKLRNDKADYKGNAPKNVPLQRPTSNGIELQSLDC